MSKYREAASPETADRVLDELRERADDSGEVWAGVYDLAEALGLSKSTIGRALLKLEAEGSIERLRMGTSAGYPSRWKIEV